MESKEKLHRSDRYCISISQTHKVKQKPKKWYHDYLQCILVTEILWAKVLITLLFQISCESLVYQKKY